MIEVDSNCVPPNVPHFSRDIRFHLKWSSTCASSSAQKCCQLFNRKINSLKFLCVSRFDPLNRDKPRERKRNNNVVPLSRITAWDSFFLLFVELSSRTLNNILYQRALIKEWNIFRWYHFMHNYPLRAQLKFQTFPPTVFPSFPFTRLLNSSLLDLTSSIKGLTTGG